MILTKLRTKLDRLYREFRSNPSNALSEQIQATYQAYKRQLILNGEK